MADIPASLDWGIVEGRVGKIITDSADPERKPDIADLVVTVTLTPSARWIRVTGEGGGIFYLGDIVCPVVDGLLVDPETNEPGVPVVATIQPNAVPARVQWTATIDAEGVVAELDPVLFNVTGGGATTPLEEQFGAEGELPYIPVVTVEDRVRAEAAAQDAMTAEAAAVNAADRADAAASLAEQVAGEPVVGEDGKLLETVLPDELTPTGLSAQFVQVGTVYTKPEMDATVAALRAKGLLGVPVDPWPAVKIDDAPTITDAATAQLAGRVTSVLTPEVTILGRQPVMNPANAAQEVSADFSGLDFYLTAAEFEIVVKEQSANGSRLWIWVDGQPVTAEGTPASVTTSTGANWARRIVFGAVARRRITVYASGLNAWVQLRVPHSAAVSPAPPLAKVAFVGDSFWAGSGALQQLSSAALTIARALGVNPVIAATGGTGYEAGSQTFGAAARRARIPADVAAIVFSGSVNDPASSATLQASAEAAYEAYASDFPGVPIVVFGVQPSNAADTTAAGRAANDWAIRQAALAAPNVIAFISTVGFDAATPPPAYSSTTTYPDGSRVTYQGSVYQLVNGGNSLTGTAPGGSARWVLRTYAYTGTGKVGTTTGDGTRDVALAADGIHPTLVGSNMLAANQERDIRDALT